MVSRQPGKRRRYIRPTAAAAPPAVCLSLQIFSLTLTVATQAVIGSVLQLDELALESNTTSSFLFSFFSPCLKMTQRGRANSERVGRWDEKSVCATAAGLELSSEKRCILASPSGINSEGPQRRSISVCDQGAAIIPSPRPVDRGRTMRGEPDTHGGGGGGGEEQRGGKREETVR